MIGYMKAADFAPRVLRLASAALTVGALAAALAPSQAGAQMAFNKASLPTDTVGAKRVAKPAPKPVAKPLTFSQKQQDHERVLIARVEKKFELKQLFREQGLTYPAAEIFLRIFKRERELEVWVRPEQQTAYVLLKKYPICAMAGQLGPKRSQGDGQTPEGFYFIDNFNPSSDFHLSLHLDYPNRSDQILNAGHELGGNIFIHGGCRTQGCMAVTDDAIKELYWLSVEARNAGQSRIPVHIFPARLTDDELYRLTQVFTDNPQLKRFWANLKPTFDYFESKHEVPFLDINARGQYRIIPAPVIATDSSRAVKVSGGTH